MLYDLADRVARIGGGRVVVVQMIPSVGEVKENLRISVSCLQPQIGDNTEIPRTIRSSESLGEAFC